MNNLDIDTARNVLTACSWWGLVFFVLVGLLTALKAYTAVIYVCAIGSAWCLCWLGSECWRHRPRRLRRKATGSKVGWDSV